MAVPFDIQLSMSEAPSEAQARAAESLADPARQVGLRLTKRGAGVLTFRPRVQFPFLLMLWHSITGERMTVSFQPDGQEGTRVLIAGVVSGAHHALAADPEHWTEGLGGTGAGV